MRFVILIFILTAAFALKSQQVFASEDTSMKKGELYCPAPKVPETHEDRSRAIIMSFNCKAKGWCLNYEGDGCMPPVIWKGDLR